ncbi:flagellar basal-body rod protein FlgF [Desulfolucanica intricata]|uniref:flagellar basal-body rod protein FlgF n=1 Tax=Desulfolucanica intricata TaxID=1285191 RepID=UPI000833DABB|nr:flagellar basal-body rod protein FlgF [Desulfolucanica intricata]
MIRGIYSGAYGMNVLQLKMEVMSNNLANINTNGFKNEQIVAKSFNEQLMNLMDERKGRTYFRPVGLISQGAVVDEVSTDFSQGTLEETGLDTDFAISGNGFFTVETPEGIYYTRDGSFALDNYGYLVSSQGYTLLGQAGPVEIGQGNSFTVDKDGVIYVNGEEKDRLLITDFINSQQLEKVGDNYYRADRETELQSFDAENYQIRQGFLERSNTDLVKELTNMLTVARAYETNQKLIQVQDELLGKAVNNVGVVK